MESWEFHGTRFIYEDTVTQFSVIIPYESNPALLEETLLSLLENRPEECEILVVLNTPYANPYELREEEVRFVENSRKKDLVTAILTGLEAAESPVVQILPCGAKVCEGWSDEPLKQFRETGNRLIFPKEGVQIPSGTFLADFLDACQAGSFQERMACFHRIHSLLHPLPSGGVFQNVVRFLGNFLWKKAPKTLS